MSDRFIVSQYDDGQLYVKDHGRETLHADLRDTKRPVIQVGSDCDVTIDKVYGPLVAMDLRITMDIESCEWVIRRERFEADAEGNHVRGWDEAARIPMQTDSDFPDDVDA